MMPMAPQIPRLSVEIPCKADAPARSDATSFAHSSMSLPLKSNVVIRAIAEFKVQLCGIPKGGTL